MMKSNKILMKMASEAIKGKLFFIFILGFIEYSMMLSMNGTEFSYFYSIINFI